MRSKNVMLVGMLLLLQLMHHRVSSHRRARQVYRGQNVGDSCVNPYQNRGTCVNIRACEPLLNLLRTSRQNATAFLNDSVCTFIDNDPIVCCPNVGNNNGNNDNSNSNNNNNNNGNPSIPTQPNNNRYGPLVPPFCGNISKHLTRIVDGSPANLGAWPWIAALGYHGRQNPETTVWLCGGALISARHVLTAAHCIHRNNNLFIVRLGELDLASDNDGAMPIDVLINRASVHPQYNPTSHTNDIGVIRLDREIQFSAMIQPICLPVTQEIRETDLTNRYPFVVGWGAIFFNGPRSSILQQVQLPIVSLGQCQAAFKNIKSTTIDERVVCAGFPRGGKDACQGDSGGPLMTPFNRKLYVIGVVSYGAQCAQPGFPGVYSRTTAFLDFILPLLN